MRSATNKLLLLALRSKNVFNRPSRLIFTSSIKRSGDYEWQDPKSPDEILRSNNLCKYKIIGHLSVNITYVNRDGSKIHVKGKVGDNVMYLAHRYKIPVEGACEASLACSTCHVYVDEKYLDKLPSPKDEEEDMLDLAPFLKSNSRLSCQIILKKDLDGITVTLPQATRNFYIDGHVPEPH